MHRNLRGPAAFGLALALTACSHGGQQGQGAPPLAVSVATAQRSDIATAVQLDGQIAPKLSATLSTPQSGTLVTIYVDEGQRVHAGELLAKLDDSTLRASLAQNEAVVAQSKAQLGAATLQGQITPANAQSTIATAQQQLQAARNNVAADEAALSNAKLGYDSNAALLKQGYVAQTTTEQTRAAYVAAQQALISAQQTEVQAEVALKAARAQSINAVPIQNQQIATSRATLSSAQAAVKLLQAEIAQTSLVAPFDGVVTQRLLDPGAYAGPNQPIVQLSQIDPVYLNVNVPDNDLAYVRRGTPITFTSSSLPGRTFHGAVFDVNAVPTTGTLSYRARVLMPNPDAALRGGMLVTVSVRTAYHPDAIVVPLTAVAQGPSGATVYTIAPLPPPPAAAAGGAPPGGAKPGGPASNAPPLLFAQAKLVPVTVGLQTDVVAEVHSPAIQPGTLVIVNRPDALQDKSPVAYTAPPSVHAALPRKDTPVLEADAR